MPIERDDVSTRIFGTGYPGLEFYFSDRTLGRQVYLLPNGRLNIEGEGGAGAGVKAGAWLGFDGIDAICFRPDMPAVFGPGGQVTEYDTIQAAINAAASGETVELPPKVYDEGTITLKDGVIVHGPEAIINCTSADVAVTTAAGGYIRVKEIKADRTSNNKCSAVLASHASGTCVVVAELILSDNDGPEDAYGVRHTGTGTTWVFAERIQGITYDEWGGALSAEAGVLYARAAQFLGRATSSGWGDGVFIGGGELHAWGECRGESVNYWGYGLDIISGSAEIWGNCVGYGPDDENGYADGANFYGGTATIHGECIGEAPGQYGVADGVTMWPYASTGNFHVYGHCIATSADGFACGVWVEDENDYAGTLEVWGKATATCTYETYGIYLKSRQTTPLGITVRVNGDAIATGGSWKSYGAYCEAGTLTLTNGRASGDDYDLIQAVGEYSTGTLQIHSVQYDTYSGTITHLPTAINALVALLQATTELTISAGGAITVTQAYHRVDTNADGATDDLDTINGGVTGQLLVLRPENDARTVVVKHNTGNIWMLGAADVSLDDVNDHLMLVFDGSKWASL